MRQFSSYQARLAAIVVTGVLVRLFFWHSTRLVLEDALITFRYAENLATGNGMVYNIGERIMGSTTPLWTLILAGMKLCGSSLFLSCNILNILFDSATCLLMASILTEYNRTVALLWALLFALSPDIIPITMSGMETSLLLFSMSLTCWGAVRKNAAFAAGIVLVLMTRIDGVIFVAIASAYGLFYDKRWFIRSVVFAFLGYLPWLIFSIGYFGTIVPQSVIAKLSSYNFNIRDSFAPFLNYFSPLLERSPWKLLIKNISFLLSVAGIYFFVRARGWKMVFPLFFFIYCIVYMFSGRLIFTWYFIPAIFFWLVFIAAGIQSIATKIVSYLHATNIRLGLDVAFVLILIVIHLTIFRTRIEKYGEIQQLEDSSRKQIGLWLRQNAPPGSRVFLEPLGYIGYYAGPSLRIYDEIGLVTPEVISYRRLGNGWYKPCLEGLEPDFVVQYSSALENNRSEGSGAQLFTNQQQRDWFYSEYQPVMRFDLSDKFPGLELKEKKFIVFRHTGNPGLRSPRLFSSFMDTTSEWCPVLRRRGL